LLGQMVRAANDSFLVQRLTRHAADEAWHAAIWADAIAEVDLHSSSRRPAPRHPRIITHPGQQSHSSQPQLSESSSAKAICTGCLFTRLSCRATSGELVQDETGLQTYVHAVK
jgi:hypothetical protein